MRRAAAGARVLEAAPDVDRDDRPLRRGGHRPDRQAVEHAAVDQQLSLPREIGVKRPGRHMLAPTASYSGPRRCTTCAPVTRSQLTQRKSRSSSSIVVRPERARSIERARPPRSREVTGTP